MPDECRWRQFVACPVPDIRMGCYSTCVNLIRWLLSRLCCILRTCSILPDWDWGENEDHTDFVLRRHFSSLNLGFDISGSHQPKALVALLSRPSDSRWERLGHSLPLLYLPMAQIVVNRIGMRHIVSHQCVDSSFIII